MVLQQFDRQYRGQMAHDLLPVIALIGTGKDRPGVRPEVEADGIMFISRHCLAKHRITGAQQKPANQVDRPGTRTGQQYLVGPDGDPLPGKLAGKQVAQVCPTTGAAKIRQNSVVGPGGTAYLI